MLIHTEINTKQEIISTINKLRRANKNQWYYFDIEGRYQIVRCMCFGTWIKVHQHYKRDTNGLKEYLKDSSPMDLSVKEFNRYLNDHILYGFDELLSTNKIGEYPPKTLIPTNKKG